MENDKKKSKRKLTKKVKIAVIAAVLAVVFVLTFVLCWFFAPEIYDVDLDAIRQEGNIFWQDEFDAPSGYWAVEAEGKPRRGGYWVDEMVLHEKTTVGNEELNVMKIRTQKGDDGKWYTAGVQTSDLFAYKYGYVEASIRLPKAYGQWSAFWTMPVTGFQNVKDAKTNGSEIDIMEAPCYPKEYVQQAVHIGGYGDDTHTSIFPLSSFMVERGDIYDSFHTYGLYWDANMYKFYVDGKCVWTTSYNRSGNVSQVFQYLFLSTEIPGKNGVYGDNPWTVAAPGKTADDTEGDHTDFEIDYVRAYKIDSTEFYDFKSGQTKPY